MPVIVTDGPCIVFAGVRLAVSEGVVSAAALRLPASRVLRVRAQLRDQRQTGGDPL